MSSQRLLTLMEVADMLRVSPHTIRAWIRKGRLRPVRICRRVLLAPSDVQQFLTENTQPRLAEACNDR